MGSPRRRHRRIVYMWLSMSLIKQALAAAEILAEASMRAAAAAVAWKRTRFGWGQLNWPADVGIVDHGGVVNRERLKRMGVVG